MRLSSPFKQTIPLLCLILALFSTLVLGEPSLADKKGRYEMAMEVELSAIQLKPLLPLFDWGWVENEIEKNPKALPRALARKYVRWKSQPLNQRDPKIQAEVVIALASAYGQPPLRHDLNGDDAATLEGMIWHRDNGKMEIKFNGSTNDPAAYLKRITHFAKMAGIEAALNAPIAAKGQPVSYHFHISRTDGTDLTAKVTAYNRLMLMRLIDKNAARDLFFGRRTSKYSEELYSRGLVRMIAKDHFELRRHVEAPPEELTELIRWLHMPDELAVVEMEKETQRLLTKKNLARLIRHRVSTAVIIVGSVAHVSGQAGPQLTDPNLRRVYSELTRRPIYGPELVAVLEGLHTHEKKKVPFARELLIEISNSFQTTLDEKTLSELVNHFDASEVRRALNLSNQYSTATSIDSSHPKVASAVMANKSSNSPFGYLRLLIHYADGNPILEKEMLNLIGDKKTPLPLRAAALHNAPSSVVASPRWWPILRQMHLSSDATVRKAAEYHVANFSARYDETKLAALRNEVSALYPVAGGEPSTHTCPADLSRLKPPIVAPENPG